MLNARPKNLQIENALYLVTTVTQNRRDIFHQKSTAELMVAHILKSRELAHFWLYSFVIMPDHLHLIVKPYKRTLSKGVGSLKGSSARALNEMLLSRGKIWQRGYMSRPIVSMELFFSENAYIESNPVRAGIVSGVNEYEFSSANPEYMIDFQDLPSL